MYVSQERPSLLSLRSLRAAAEELGGMESAAWEPKKVGYKLRPASTSDNVQVLPCPCKYHI